MTCQQLGTCAHGHSPSYCSHHDSLSPPVVARPEEISMKDSVSHHPSHQGTRSILLGGDIMSPNRRNWRKNHRQHERSEHIPTLPGITITAAHTFASYYKADAPPAPARAAIMIRTTSRTTPHQLTFFIIMPNYNLFRYQQAELQPHIPFAPWLAQGHTLLACLHRV